MKKNILLFLLAGNLFVLNCQPKIIINADNPGAKISKDLYGIFFEDINHAGEGGIYAELIRNRSFEENREPEDMYWEGEYVHSHQGWKHRYVRPEELSSWSLDLKSGAKGSIKQVSDQPLNENNPMCMQIVVENPGEKGVTVKNTGFWGISAIKGDKYLFSLYAKCADGFKGDIMVGLLKNDGSVVASEKISGIGNNWQKFSCTLTASETDPNTMFFLIPLSKGKLWVDMVSLFPEKTFKNRENGMRLDLAQLVEEFKPGFIRFPGGCIVEGATLENRIQWKNTIGDITQRKGHWLLWDYHSTDGLGYHEFLQFCEDIGTPGMYVFPVGMSCQFRRCEYVSVDSLQPYIQEVMDALEYALGETNTKWGAERAKNGHPEPFNLKYVEIGNENYGPIYQDHYNYFYKAIKEKYPDIITITCTDPGMRDDFKREDLAGITEPVEIIDEHFYESTDFFYRAAYRYDDYDRNGPKIYCGEYAVKKWNNTLKGNLDAALAEAAFMTGMERNADIVELSSMAPTFVNDSDRNWNPDLITFNSHQAYGNPSYQVQKLFSTNIPDNVLPTVVENSGYATNPPDPGVGIVGLFNIATKAKYKDVSIRIGGKTFTENECITREGLDKKQQDYTWFVDYYDYLDLPVRKEVYDFANENGGWDDYTLTLKAFAEEISDLEAFAINFYSLGQNKHYTWNVGRWLRWYWLQWYDNGYESYFGQKAGTIDVGKWYDISITVRNDSVICYLDNKLVHNVPEPDRVSPGIYATSGILDNGDIIVKVVNPLDADTKIPVEVQGGTVSYSKAKIEWISGDRYGENTFANPLNISPKTKIITIPGNTFEYTFPASSVTVITLIR
ncbi:MAG: hypothetical protein JXB49_18495 [Bacteroidales bacterium]|nr:hypothetical protein [Bacteroidales bacterium]